MKNEKKKSLVFSIMCLCVAVVVLTACIVGTVGIVSIRKMSSASYATYEAAVDDGYRTEIKSQVQGTIAILQSEYDKAQAGLKTEEEAKNDAKEIIRVMRYRDDDSGYFWIDDTDYILIMHPILAENEGNNRYDLEDQNGVMIIQEIMKVCDTAEHGGYNEFYFTKSDGVTVAPKLAYSELFEPWGWAVSTGNYVDDMEAEEADVLADINGEYTRTFVFLIVMLCVAVVLASVIAFIAGKRIVAPLKQIQAFAGNIAKGDLTTSVRIAQTNEIGQTAHALTIAQDNIRELLSAIAGVAQEINGSITSFDESFGQMRGSLSQVSTAVESIAENVTNQASSTDDAGEDVGIIAERIKQTGEEVFSLNENTKEMNQISEKSVGTLQQLIGVNNKTRDSISAMAKQTESTYASAQQIQVAANLINEIADQTSLLALNASIEAARAGDSGRGFAVVADEIAKLANQSTESVEEINHILGELQSNAKRSVEVMREINDSVEVQVHSLTDTQQIFSRLHQELGNCAVSVQTIDKMTVELENQRSNVTQSLDVLNRIAQDNAAVAQETAAMSAELSKAVDDSGTLVENLENKVSVLITNVDRFTL